MQRHPRPIALPDQRIGLLGGSFNPAHQGHMHISTEALKRLELDWVWWLISPQNPLKPETGTPLEERLSQARAQISHPRILASDLEADLGTRFTIDTVDRIQQRWPETLFVWLTGADIFVELPEWKAWEKLIGKIPFAVFDRPGFGLRALSGMAATRYRAYRLDMDDAPKLATATPPAWCFLHIPTRDVSSTRLRNVGD